MSALREVLSRLEKVSKAAQGTYRACCPAHEDSNPSLSITLAGGKVLLHCHAGCETEDIAGAIGLEMRDLFDDERERRNPTGCSVTDLAQRFGISSSQLRRFGLKDHDGRVRVPYLDRQGRLLRSKIRMKVRGKEGKYIHAKDGNGSHLYGLWQPVPVNSEVVLTEGESDSWCLWSVGIPAYGVPGATNLSVVQKRHFEGIEQCWIAGDNDEAGRKFQAKAAEILERWGIECWMLNAPREYNDLAEWKVATSEKWRSAVKRAMKQAPQGVDDGTVLASDVEEEDINYLMDPHIPRGYLTILAGKPGRGKSLTTCAIAAAVTEGKDICNCPVEQGDVMIFSAEDDIASVIRPRLRRCGADLNRVRLFRFDVDDILLDDEGLERLESLINKYEPKLVVLDPLVVFMGGEVDVNRSNEVRAKLKPLAMLAMRADVAILIVAHSPKSARSAIDNISHSGDFAAAIRSGLSVHPDPEGDESCSVLAHFKHSTTMRGPSLRYQIRPCADNPKHPSFAFTSESGYTAQELLSITEEDYALLTEACMYLAGEVAEPADQRAIFAKAASLGIPRQVVRMAKKREGIEARHTGFGSESKIVWYYPEREVPN